MKVETTVRKNGFTLYELMVAVAVFLVLTVIGVPSYISYVRNSQLSHVASALYIDLAYARSEAMKRKADVVICRSIDSNSATPSCGGSTNTWSNGWLIFIDVGGGAGSYDAGTDKLLRATNVASGNTVAIISNNAADQRIVYNADGTLNALTTPSVLAMCDDRDQNGSYDASYGREIRISATGRPEIKTGNIASCSNPT